MDRRDARRVITIPWRGELLKTMREIQPLNLDKEAGSLDALFGMSAEFLRSFN